MTEDPETAERVDPLRLRTLVLNADYRPLSAWPLSVIPATEAISTVWKERAQVVETWERVFFNTPSTRFAVPKVIALKDYVHVDAEPKFCRRNVLLRDRFSCQYCGGRFSSHDLTYDHVVPRARGGKTEWTNIVMACVACNAAKQSAMPNYSGQKGRGLRPLRPPRVPTKYELERAAFAHASDLNPRHDPGPGVVGLLAGGPEGVSGWARGLGRGPILPRTGACPGPPAPWPTHLATKSALGDQQGADDRASP